MHVRLLCPEIALLFCLLSIASVGETSAGARPESLRDEWHMMVVNGQPAGFLHRTVRGRTGGGFVERTVCTLTLRRGTDRLESEIATVVEEGHDGRIHGFQVAQKQSKETSTTVGVRSGDALVVTETPNGKEPRTSRLTLDRDAVGAYRARDIVRATLKQPGDAVVVKIFDPRSLKVVQRRTVFEREEEVDLQGLRQTLRRLASPDDNLPGMTLLEWYDASGDLQKSAITVAGLELVTYRTTIENISTLPLHEPPEVFFSTAIPTTGHVRADAHAMTYRLTRRAGTFAVRPGKPLFPGAGQQVVQEDDPTTRVLRVQRIRPQVSRRLPVVPPPGLEEYLRANKFIQADDPDIVAVARQVVTREQEAWQTATSLAQWTFTHLTRKNLTLGFATAKEAMTTQTGDCTEHAVLLAALLRAAGLPTRVVAGLVYQQGAFLGHMWTEIYLDGWIPLDATRARGEVGPDHIALAVSSLASTSLGDVVLDMALMLGNVQIEGLEAVE